MGAAKSVAGNSSAEDERTMELGDLAGGGSDRLRGRAWCGQRVTGCGDGGGIGAGGWYGVGLSGRGVLSRVRRGVWI